MHAGTPCLREKPAKRCQALIHGKRPTESRGMVRMPNDTWARMVGNGVKHCNPTQAGRTGIAIKNAETRQIKAMEINNSVDLTSLVGALQQ